MMERYVKATVVYYTIKKTHKKEVIISGPTRFTSCALLAKSPSFLGLNFRFERSGVKSLRDILQMERHARNRRTADRDTYTTALEQPDRNSKSAPTSLNHQVHRFSSLRILSSFTSQHPHDNTSALQK